MSKIYDLIWKKSETQGKAQWEKVGVLLEKEDGKKSLKHLLWVPFLKKTGQAHMETGQEQDLPLHRRMLLE
jgi:hypothetical protein